MRNLNESGRLKPWRPMDSFMLVLCFVAFAVLGYFLAKQILS